MDTDMIFRALGVALVVTGLGACTTVDLSQISESQERSIILAPAQNVVERASHSLTAMFRGKGWCKGTPQEKTQSATSVLLNGVTNASAKQTSTLIYNSGAALRADMLTAAVQVNQTTKAAEVFLSMADELTELEAELSSLEIALLSARQAQSKFGLALVNFDTPENKRIHGDLTRSVDGLKTVTDAYGVRLRRQIAAGSTRAGS